MIRFVTTPTVSTCKLEVGCSRDRVRQQLNVNLDMPHLFSKSALLLEVASKISITGRIGV